MDNIIDMEQWKSERQQCNISPRLQQAARLRQTARTLVMAAEAIEIEAYSLIDYDVMAEEKVKNLRALHNA